MFGRAKIPLLALLPALWACSGGSCSRKDGEAARGDATTTESGTQAHAVPRPSDALADFGVLTNRPRAELEAELAPEAAAAALTTRHCGPKTACDQVRAMLRDPRRVELQIESAEDFGVPPEATLPDIAKGLDPRERAAAASAKTVVAVRVRGQATPDGAVARTALALALFVSEAAKGFTYDESTRRMENAGDAARHAPTEPLGEPLFREDRIVIQSYAQEDGTVRLVSHGMHLFGLPDLEVAGARPGSVRGLGAAMNAVAFRLAAGASTAPLEITAADARATVDLVSPPRQAGDPDNVMVRIVPSSGATADGYDALVTALYGKTEELAATGDDATDEAMQKRAAAALFPRLFERWKAANTSGKGHAKLMVLAPFRMNGDAGTEWMWVDVNEVKAATLRGTLDNSPTYATELHAGDTVTVARRDLLDVLLAFPDGGTVGGELQQRRAR